MDAVNLMVERAGDGDMPEFLRLLAHDLRWHLVKQLALSDLRVQELVERIGRPMNLISYHLAQLRRGGLVTEHRSSMDGRDIYYSLELDRVERLYRELGGRVHPMLGAYATANGADLTPWKDGTPARVLFLCTHNSARSQMAEAMLRQIGGPTIEVASAGVEVTSVHSLALETLSRLGIDATGLYSKHLELFREQTFDFIVTVCDRVREQCPTFPGDPLQIHWSIADPAAVDGDIVTRRNAFDAAALQLSVRLRHLSALLKQSAYPRAA